MSTPSATPTPTPTPTPTAWDVYRAAVAAAWEESIRARSAWHAALAVSNETCRRYGELSARCDAARAAQGTAYAANYAASQAHWAVYCATPDGQPPDPGCQ